ncbi:MAG: xanthine dehydrogenase [Candidatus Wallbacteria bacterium HGW-Wallbacteria-1]|jgi:carbon-monoxide dehydrogenase small subunit|uniref:Xanthine dehydrogenase n=1 Tax=Candidatus Wallbacteria bacterium HGW-Wallbacteria-1 TaxID=2013854 RepID=A0A2N1PRL8_9BACT|nr:MAG: xanthine dehydrogenase [Candidatus Wallbacteria bacterium HGW-Wallbacteria-1]
MPDISLTINGILKNITIDGKESLLEILRERFELFGAKEGCGYGACGSCTVIVNGKATTACTVRGLKKLDGIDVLTIEGLNPADGSLHPIQECFIEAGAVQCGFCTPGFVLRLHALFTENPNADDELLKTELSKHICRCTGYEAIWQAALASREKYR